MKRKPWESGATTGAKAEAIIDDMANKAGIPYEKDQPLSTGKRRRLDKKCDRIYILKDIKLPVEIKRKGENGALTFELYDSTRKVEIKFHQIITAEYIFFIFGWNTPVAVKKTDFLKWASTQTKMSINYKDVLKIGFEFEDLEWLKDL